jgi:hypothetical protein
MLSWPANASAFMQIAMAAAASSRSDESTRPSY